MRPSLTGIVAYDGPLSKHPGRPAVLVAKGACIDAVLLRGLSEGHSFVLEGAKARSRFDVVQASEAHRRRRREAALFLKWPFYFLKSVALIFEFRFLFSGNAERAQSVGHITVSERPPSFRHTP